nr:hypothetical protein [Stenotrophomonas acidaminiphila]
MAQAAAMPGAVQVRLRDARVVQLADQPRPHLHALRHLGGHPAVGGVAGAHRQQPVRDMRWHLIGRQPRRHRAAADEHRRADAVRRRRGRVPVRQPRQFLADRGVAQADATGEAARAVGDAAHGIARRQPGVIGIEQGLQRCGINAGKHGGGHGAQREAG